MNVAWKRGRSALASGGRQTVQRGGFSLIEVCVAMAVMAVGLLAAGSTLVSSHSLRVADAERQAAEDGTRAIVEQILAFSEASIDDPAGWARTVTDALAPGGAIGDRFDLNGLDPQAGQPSLGSIQVVTDETVTDAAAGVELGLPRDLDGNGVLGDPDVSGTASLLPVIVDVRWRGKTGNRRLTQAFYLFGKP